MTGAAPRKRPCASCPYRVGVPSGIWDETEYAKLPAYDLDTASQPTAAFFCHHQDGNVCAGWLAHAVPSELLAVRIGVLTGALDGSCFDYSTTVPLFPTGAAAAAHGRKELGNPQPAAVAAMGKIIQTRGAR